MALVYFNQLPQTGTPPKRYVDENSWNSIVGNAIAWPAHVNGNAKNLSNVGAITATSISCDMPVLRSVPDMVFQVGAGYPERMRIQAAGGNVGIGTGSPGTPLHVHSTIPYNVVASGPAPNYYLCPNAGHPNPGGNSEQTNAAFMAFASSQGAFGVNAGDLIIGTQSRTLPTNGNRIVFALASDTSGSYVGRVFITRDGSVGIGSAPTARLHLYEATANRVMASLANGVPDTSFVLVAQNGATSVPEQMRFGLNYGSIWNAGFRFFRGAAGNDGFLTIDTSGTERIRVTSGGNVGIGIIPVAILDVAGAQFGGPAASGAAYDSQLRIGSSGHGECLDLGIGGSCAWVQVRNSSNYAANYSLALQPNGGNVGISTMNPQSLLDLYQPSFSQYMLKLSNGTPSRVYGWAIAAGSGNLLLDIVGGLRILTVTGGGNVGIGTSNPNTNTTLEVFQTATLAAVMGSTAGAVGFGTMSSAGFIQGYTSTAAAAGANLLLAPVGGDVGIGLTNPAVRLQVHASNAYNLALTGFAPSLMFAPNTGHPNPSLNAAQPNAVMFGFATAAGHYSMNDGDLVIATLSRTLPANGNRIVFGTAQDTLGNYAVRMVITRDGTFQMWLGGGMKTLSVDGSGFVKAA